MTPMRVPHTPPFRIDRVSEYPDGTYVALSDEEWYFVMPTHTGAEHAPIRAGDMGLVTANITPRNVALGFLATIGGSEFKFVPRSAGEIPPSNQGGPIDGPKRIG